MYHTIRSRATILATILLVVGGISQYAFATPDQEGFYLTAYGQDFGKQYVTLQSQGFIRLYNVGVSTVHVTSIVSADPDVVGGYFAIVNTTFPLNIGPGDSARVPVVFVPNAPDIVSGERSYSATFNIFSDAANQSATVTGIGVAVHSHATIASTYTGKVGDTVVVPVAIDQWTDPLGLTSPAGLRLEVLHYRRTIVSIDPSFNTGGAGETGTITAGATVAEDVRTDTMSDAAHTSGQQGFYSLDISRISASMQSPGTLLKLRLIGVKGTDTSQLVFQVKDFRNSSGTLLPYVLMSASPGSVHIDSIAKKDTTTFVRQTATTPTGNSLTLHPNSPNPFTSQTDIRFTLENSGRAQLYVCDILGRIVSTLVSGELSAGEHQSQFSAGNLPSGEYYAVLQTGAGIVKQEMALVR